MPEAAVDVGLFDAPLRVVRRPSLDGFPSSFVHQQVTMPARPGVDGLAAAVQVVEPGSTPDGDLAVASAVRHWCGEDLGQLEVRSASAAELVREGEPVLRLTDLTLHDPTVLDEPGCPLVSVDDATRLLWTRGVRHRRGSEPVEGWVPYGQTVVRWLERDPGQPLAHTMNMAGLGAATSFEAAADEACADLVAQDAVTRWWFSGRDPLPRIEVPDWWDGPLELRLRRLPSRYGLVAVLAVVRDHERGLACLSAAVGVDAARRAAARGLWQLTVARDVMSSTSTLLASGLPGLLPHVLDRRYLDADVRRAVDPLSAVQLGLDPTVVADVDRRTAPSTDAIAPDSHQSATDALPDVWLVDLTTPDVAEAGWHCVRAIAPGLVRIPVPAFTAAQTTPYPGW